MFYSIIMPVYNAESSLETTINSVLVQSYTDFELLIVNDASTDKSMNIIHKYRQQDSRIIVIDNNSNIGVAQSRNRALSSAKGDYLAFLDADDIWQKNKLEIQKNIIERTNAKLVFSSYETINDGGKVSIREQTPGFYDYNRMLRGGNSVGLLTAVVSRRAIKNTKFQDIPHEDYQFWLEITRKGLRGLYIADVLATYRVKRNSISGNKFKSFIWTWMIYRNQPSISLSKAMKLQFLYVLNVLKRTRKVGKVV
ncbi:glycosyltransferase family 2 protein [Lactiplantibacillus plantarum]|uniref:glycosyltransferase family 2 protein n=1 Tax=Lactiplantibacillus plantarum TaxID=1590 RepID=UPI003F5348CC